MKNVIELNSKTELMGERLPKETCDQLRLSLDLQNLVRLFGKYVAKGGGYRIPLFSTANASVLADAHVSEDES